MNIILGASGQIGFQVVKELNRLEEPVRAVIRNPEKAKALGDVEVKIADFLDPKALNSAFKGGISVFLLTPENPASDDVLGETKAILDNYREAIMSSGIKRIIGLSSMGAQHTSGTGNLEMSYLLEHKFQDLSAEQIFIRPAYYFSNWLGYYDTVKNEGVLPTFFPTEQKIPMTAPTDVAWFIAGTIANKNFTEKTIEITGPSSYSSSEVAANFGKMIGKNVFAYQIPEENWASTLKQVGFSDNATDNMIKMIKAVIEGKAVPENKDIVKMKTDLWTYLSEKKS